MFRDEKYLAAKKVWEQKRKDKSELVYNHFNSYFQRYVADVNTISIIDTATLIPMLNCAANQLLNNMVNEDFFVAHDIISLTVKEYDVAITYEYIDSPLYPTESNTHIFKLKTPEEVSMQLLTTFKNALVKKMEHDMTIHTIKEIFKSFNGASDTNNNLPD